MQLGENVEKKKKNKRERMAIGTHTWWCWRIPVSWAASQHGEGMAQAWQPLTRAQAARLGRGCGRAAPPGFGFSVETLGCLSVLLRIKFHLFAVVQELGPSLGGLLHWQQP